MLYLDQAIKSRWDAKNLDATITGGLWAEMVPELTDMPYCTFTDISDAKFMQSHGSRYQSALVQFDVYDTTKAACGADCETIEAALLNADRAATNPLSIVGTGNEFVITMLLTSPYVVRLMGTGGAPGDTIWQGTMTFTIIYRRDGGLNPA